MDDFFPTLVLALGAWFVGYEFGFKRGEKRGIRLGLENRRPVEYVELPCFGGPRDGETVKFQSSCEQLRVPYVDAKVAWTWTPEGSVPPLIQQAMYRRMWIGNREQLVFQGSIGG